MNTTRDIARVKLRRSVYAVMICAVIGMTLGRILAVDAVDLRAIERDRIQRGMGRKRAELQRREITGKRFDDAMQKEEERLREAFQLTRPFLSANDRSRWIMMRALVEPEMRIPGAPYAIDKVIQEPGWDTIDMVKHKGPDGKEYLYSSKPPLLPTLMAGNYWLVYKATGMTLGTHPYVLGRLLLIVWNVIPLAIYLMVVAALIERFAKTDFARMFLMGAASFGTFLTTFATVLNNHLPAAVCGAIALYALVRIWFDGDRRLCTFSVAGFFAAMLMVCELPGASFTALIGLALLIVAARPTLLAFAPAVALVAAGFFGANWIAHESLKPPYMHRSEGDNWYDYEYERNGRVIPSYWRNPVGVDVGEESPLVYAFHVLVGHHGIFSLTPVWLTSAAGMFLWLSRRDAGRLRYLAVMIALVTLACLVFYLSRGEVYRNYGGMTSGLRWVFWLTPLWLVVASPAVDGMARNPWLRGLALGLLILSVLSVSYPTWTPWSHPWLVDGMHWAGFTTAGS